MIATCELDIFGNTEMTEDVLLDDWSDIDLSRAGMIAIAADGDVAAAGYFFHHGDATFAVYAYVHPLHRGRGLGASLVRWAERSARTYPLPAPTDAPIIVRHYPALPDASAQQLLSEQGYASERGFYVMEVALDKEPLLPEWPEGVSVRTFDPDRDEQATFETFEASFQDHWSSMITHASFREMTDGDSFDPDLWHLAFAGDEMIGICFSKLIDDAGWIDDIGVRWEWRRRGVGLALLHHAFGALYARGGQAVGLSVDAQSLTGAPRLFERAGMQIKRSYILYQKELRS